MSDTPSSEEMARLRALVPLHTLADEALDELVEGATFESLSRGKILIEQGDTDHENVYLLEGSVALLSGKAVVERVRAGTDTARFPIAHQLPRKHSVRAESRVRIVRIDSRRLSDLLSRSQTVDYQVADFDEATEDDWMSKLLQSRVLQQVPAANIQQVMMNVERVELAKGEDLIRQGDPGDFYYMLTSGRAVVRRDNGDGKGPCELATLGPGDAFGEEALLSDQPRNSTVTMLQDGEVLRLSKEHFLQLIQNPLLERLDMRAAQAKVDQGAVWLDLRSSEQYDDSHLPGAINLPFESLRYQASSLSLDCPYVLYSNMGRRAMAGAFMLAERGFDVTVLEGGMLQRPAVDDAQGSDATDAAAGAVIDDAAAQARIREAEARAKELEDRLEQVRRDQESMATERQQHLEQVRQAVDQTRRKLLETEEQKREALAAQEKAYAEMERLTGSLEQLHTERSSLLDRMSEIEGLDKQLQARLAKAERELIGERERAESATSSLEDLSERLNEVLAKRDEEREQSARERGELKEELTALQMELEQAQLDMQELHEQLAEHQAQTSHDSGELELARQQLAAAEAEGQKMLTERDALQRQVEALNAQLEEQGAAQERLAALQGELEDHDQAAERLTEQLTALTAERDALAERLGLAQEQAAQLEQTQRAATEREREELERALADAQADAERRISALHDELAQLRADNSTLQSEIASGNQEAGAAIEQARARAVELEARLEAETARAEEQLGAKQAELDALVEQSRELQERLRQEQSTREDLEARLGEVQAARGEMQQAHDTTLAERDEARAALARSQADQDALKAQLAEDSAEAGAAVEQAQTRAAELEQQLSALQASTQTELEQLQQRVSELEQEREEAAAGLAASRQEVDAVRAEATALQAKLDEELADADRAAQSAAQELQAELERLQAENASLRSQTLGGGGDVDEAVAQLRNEIAELAQRLEERETALNAAREQQSELIDALNAANAEQETLQLAISDKEEEQARLTDLENQVAQALHDHQAEMLAQEKAQQHLREQLSEESGRRQALQEEVERLNELLEALDEDDDVDDDEVRAERDALVAELALRESEIEQLRGVLEEYVDQIRAAQSGDEDASEVTALRAELEMVREQAIRDVAHMREQLATAETQRRRLQQADDREAVSYEAMRQRIEGLESSLGERQRELSDAEDARHMLEDSLEDVNRQLDDLRRELEQTRAEAEEAASGQREAESAKQQLQEAFQRMQNDAEEVRVIDLRDDRLQASKRPIGIDSVAAPRRLVPGLVGAGIVVAILEAVSFMAGKGELFSALLKLSSQ